MSRLALPADVRLAFDPTMSSTALTNDAFLGTGDDADAVDSIIQNAESAWHEHVPRGYRLESVTRPEVHQVETDGHLAYKDQFTRVRTDYTPRAAEVNVDHAPIMPIDSSEGDKVEVRKGMDDWEDVTGASDDEYDLVDPANGTFLFDLAKVFLDQGVRMRTSADRRWVRIQYRYGARGGSIRVGGQTTLGAQLAQGGTPSDLSVADASFLPPAPFIGLVFDESDPVGTGEYVRVTTVDTTNDDIEVATRGLRLTSDSAHTSGEILHYAPLFVREAVAKKAAIDLTQADDYSTWLPDTDIPLPAPRKLDEWRNDWNEAIALLS